MYLGYSENTVWNTPKGATATRYSARQLSIGVFILEDTRFMASKEGYWRNSECKY